MIIRRKRRRRRRRRRRSRRRRGGIGRGEGKEGKRKKGAAVMCFPWKLSRSKYTM